MKKICIHLAKDESLPCRGLATSDSSKDLCCIVFVVVVELVLIVIVWNTIAWQVIVEGDLDIADSQRLRSLHFVACRLYCEPRV